jgi:DNA-binding MarR family transcriptional regulator
MATDSVDRMIEGWRRARPDLDVDPVAVVARLARVRDHLDYELEALFVEHGLSGPTFGLLVTMKRLDGPDGVALSELHDAMGRPPGTLKLRVDRLIGQGLLERRGDQRFGLSPEGERLFDAAAPAHLRNVERLLAPLDDDERDQLAGLLRKLLLAYEGER